MIAAQKPCLQEMVEAFEEPGGNIVAALQVPAEHISHYGILNCEHSLSSLMPLKGLAEKPSVGTVRSKSAVIGRYILSPKVLENLDALRVGRDCEVQRTDAIMDEILAGCEVYGCRLEGQRFDCGSKSGLLQATVAFGLACADICADLQVYLARTLTKIGCRVRLECASCLV